jgi:hypothetical protein
MMPPGRMASDPQPKLSRDQDGVRVVTVVRPRTVLHLAMVAAGVVVVTTLAAVLWIRRAVVSGARALAGEQRADVSAGAAAPGAVPVAPPAVAAGEGAVARRIATPRRRSSPPPTAPAAPPPELDAADLILELRARGEQGGIAAFGVPGTDPPRPGIIVPEDFPLPEGYVRHYQTTDDGEQLPPILMFHPDFEFVDGQGDPVALPADGVVPPVLAPSGLAIQMLEVPDRAERPR